MVLDFTFTHIYINEFLCCDFFIYAYGSREAKMEFLDNNDEIFAENIGSEAVLPSMN